MLGPLGERRRHMEIVDFEMGSLVVALSAAGAAVVRASSGLSNSAIVDTYAALALFKGVSIDVSHTPPTTEDGAVP